MQNLQRFCERDFNFDTHTFNALNVKQIIFLDIFSKSQPLGLMKMLSCIKAYV